jgi:hypothetical protein
MDANEDFSWPEAFAVVAMSWAFVAALWVML